MFCRIVFYFLMFFKYFKQIVCKYSQDIFNSSLQIFFSHSIRNIWNIMTRYKTVLSNFLPHNIADENSEKRNAPRFNFRGRRMRIISHSYYLASEIHFVTFLCLFGMLLSSLFYFYKSVGDRKPLNHKECLIDRKLLTRMQRKNKRELGKQRRKLEF